jgi:hypothetical protein
MRALAGGLACVIAVASCGKDDSAASTNPARGGSASAVGGASNAGKGAGTGGRGGTSTGGSGAGGQGAASSGSSGKGGGASGRGGTTAAGGDGASAGQSGSGGGGGDATAGSGGDVSGGSGGAAGGVTVGEWTDAPGACPAGSVRVDITTLGEMEDASRGDSHADATCFFVHDGTYVQNGSTLPLYFRRGGAAGAPVTWIGESRAGVRIEGRATFDVGANHLVLSNMTFDISNLTQTGAYDTITVLASDITLSHLTLTGDCAHGLRGGHVEVPGIDDPSAPVQDHVVIDSCLIEKFGHCASGGELDHGIYLSSGNDIVVRNNVVRENSSRGIQIYTHYEDSSLSLTNLLVERNRIEANGHGDYQDGMVVNGNVDSTFVGPIVGLVVRNNVFWHNRYSAIRFVGNSVKGVEISHNTFVEDGADSTSSNRSELNLDDGTPEATASGNVFAPANAVVNSCVGSLSVDDNVVFGAAAGGACVTSSLGLDPDFVDAAGGDFHAQNPDVDGYGAYAFP